MKNSNYPCRNAGSICARSNGDLIPIETLIYQYQDEYYRTLNQSNSDGESTIFIEFIIHRITALASGFLILFKKILVFVIGRLWVMILENKLNVSDSSELARIEERISKKKAILLFESRYLYTLKAGTIESLLKIHQYLFDEI